MSTEATTCLSLNFGSLSQSSLSDKGSICIEMGAARNNAGMFIIRPDHIDMIRFIKRWIREGNATHKTLNGSMSSFRGKRYLRAMDHAASRNQLVVLTAETRAPMSERAFDSLIAVILMGDHGLPVRPLIFASSLWADQISWDLVATQACKIQSIALGRTTQAPLPSPQLVTLHPNTNGCCTLSATRGPSTLEFGDCWSFGDTLQETLQTYTLIDKKSIT